MAWVPHGATHAFRNHARSRPNACRYDPDAIDLIIRMPEGLGSPDSMRRCSPSTTLSSTGRRELRQPDRQRYPLLRRNTDTSALPFRRSSTSGPWRRPATKQILAPESP